MISRSSLFIFLVTIGLAMSSGQPHLRSMTRPSLPSAQAAGLPAPAKFNRGLTLTDLWVDGTHGDDSNSGADRANALQSITAAWQRIPSGAPLTTTGYRILITAGDYAESTFPEYWEDRHGTADFPILIQGADPNRTARLLGDLNLYHVSHIQISNLYITHPSDVFHCERCDHLWLRDNTFLGSRAGSHENIKLNQSQYIYLEENDIDGAEQNAVDFVAVQYGHIVNNRIHNADDWCIYLKGGSAYFRLEGNEIYDCGTGGFTAGEGSGFEYLVSPWLHYEAYAIKVVNNVIHDTDGAGLGVSGGYQILFAYNTLYRVGARSHLLEFGFGGRSCDGDSNLPGQCAAHLAAGGWGTATVGDGGQPIPNRQIYVYNNLIYNPAGYQSQWQHLTIYAPRTPDAASNIPNPAYSDDGLTLRGNLIWNGPADHSLGLGEDTGCQPDNATCNETQLLADNTINTVEPQLVDPENGDFRPVAEGVGRRNATRHRVFAKNSVSQADRGGVPIPDFPTWAALTPAAPAGDLSNAVTTDRNGMTRPANSPPGAYLANSVPANTPTATVTEPAAVTATPTLISTTPPARLYLPAVSNANPAPIPTITATPSATSAPTATPSSTSSPTVTPASTGSPTATPTATSNATPLPSGAVTLVTLGDSLTEGQGDDSPSGGGYPNRLLAELTAVRPGSTITNLGHSGWSSADLIAGLNGEPSQLTTAVNLLTGASGAKVAIVWIGSNDLWYLYEYNNPSPQDEVADQQHFRTNLDTILADLRATGATVLVALLDDQSQRPVIADPPNPNEPAFTGISEAERLRMSDQVDSYNAAIRASAGQHGAIIVDFFNTTIFTTPATLADDGNHPNGAGYDAITQIWWGAIEGLVGE